MAALRHRSLSGYGLLLGSSLILFILSAHKTATKHAVVIDRSIAELALDRSEPICEALAARKAPLQMTATFTPGHPGIWDVLCTASGGKEVANLRWDAGNGKLLSAGLIRPYTPGEGAPLSTPMQALQRARIWLSLLDASDPDTHWKLSRPKYVAPHKMWIVMCISNRMTLLLNLDARSGLLTSGFASYAIAAKLIR